MKVGEKAEKSVRVVHITAATKMRKWVSTVCSKCVVGYPQYATKDHTAARSLRSTPVPVGWGRGKDQ